MKPLTVLFLCTGNTCRSPLAEVLAGEAFGAMRVRFLSAGLQAMPGQPASEGSQAVAAEMGASLDTFRSRHLSLDLVEQADWIIGMTRAHVAIFKARFEGFHTGKVGLLGEPGEDLAASRATPPAEEVQDPFGGSTAAYQAVGRQIQRLLAGWSRTFDEKP